jgi:hypothetical protein
VLCILNGLGLEISNARLSETRDVRVDIAGFVLAAHVHHRSVRFHRAERLIVLASWAKARYQLNPAVNAWSRIGVALGSPDSTVWINAPSTVTCR